MFIDALSGYLGSATSGYPVKFFGFTLPAWSARHDDLKELMSIVHLGLALRPARGERPERGGVDRVRGLTGRP